MSMDYRKFSKTVKGMHIRWGGDIFPDYRGVSGPHVSHKRLQRAKSIVVLILAQVIVNTQNTGVTLLITGGEENYQGIPRV